MSYPLVDLSGRAESGGNGPSGVPAQPDLPALENAVLASWAADDTFERSVAENPTGTDGSNEYVFYDGPPFANGLPHYGHLLTGYVKDLVPRYQTMRGRHVERRFGWDCHGLPAELEAERQLGITSKAGITELGIEKFNEVCRSSVLKYTHEWQAYVTRQARWVDFAHDYKTLDLPYMESVLWAFKTLWDKGLVYSSYRVLPYCWRDETPLSAHELRMDDDVYQTRRDPAVTVAFTLADGGVGTGPAETGDRVLAWTTTPWTLPSNLALAVGPELRYVRIRAADGEIYILAADRVGAYARELGEAPEVLGELTGADLLGRRYTPLFDYLTDTAAFATENAFRIIAADHVTTDEGTGVVHMAPAYGEEDQKACEAAGIPTILTVDERARFTDVVPDLAGIQVFDANPLIVRTLREQGTLLRREDYDHSYPHCWRCRTPLIYRAVSSWFVEVTRFRDRMVELNQDITWIPGNVKDGQFGKWLANARDWSISRNRFWGTPIPVWVSDDPAYPRTDVYGSLDDLERDFGVRPTDLHRPFVDALTRPNPDDPTGRSVMRRVPDVLDVWFDSGSMPFAQVHYPFENTDWFDHHYPGDFIVEYIGQTRGWFYLLHVLATALFDRPAFRTCMAHGIVLGDDGAKMSKSLRNYPDVDEVFSRDGSDAMRWFLMASPILRGGNLVVTEAGIREGVRQALLPLWNAWYFLALYADAEAVTARTDALDSAGGTDPLDRYILARTRALVADVTGALDSYDVAGACAELRDFCDDLTNWYIRRSRSRFWAGDRAAFDTLASVLEVTCRVAAPLLPLTTEAIWRGLTGGESVHLEAWPELEAPEDSDAELVRATALARAVCSAALSVRKAQRLRVRLPLSTLTIATADAGLLEPLRAAIAQEINVRSVILSTDVTEHARSELIVNARAAGPRLGRAVQTVIRAVKAGDWEQTDEGPRAGGHTLLPGEYEQRTVVADPDASAVLAGGSGVVVLDTVVTPELAAEGLARDVVRAVQQARRDAGFDVSDRIRLTLGGSDRLQAAVQAHRELVAAETLAVDLAVGPLNPAAAGHPVALADEEQLELAVSRA
jgi:isoleucyl-tRNA synthetase